jgi:hypothetical protein
VRHCRGELNQRLNFLLVLHESVPRDKARP